MKAWKVILATLVIFSTGLFAGVFMGQRTANPQAAQNPHPGPPMGGPPGQPRLQGMLRRMDRELNLSPEQHTKISTIIASSEERTRALWQPVNQEFQHETTKVCEEIRNELTPDQQIKFDAFKQPHPDRGDRPEGRRRGSRTNFPPDLPGTNSTNSSNL